MFAAVRARWVQAHDESRVSERVAWAWRAFGTTLGGLVLTRDQAPAAPSVGAIDNLTVARVMKKATSVVLATTSIRALADELESVTIPGTAAPDVVALDQRWLVVDARGAYLGSVTRAQIVHARPDPSWLDKTAARLVTDDGIAADPDEPARNALARMSRNDRAWLPVVGRGCPRPLLGYVARDDLAVLAGGWET